MLKNYLTKSLTAAASDAIGRLSKLGEKASLYVRKASEKKPYDIVIIGKTFLQDIVHKEKFEKFVVSFASDSLNQENEPTCTDDLIDFLNDLCESYPNEIASGRILFATDNFSLISELIKVDLPYITSRKFEQMCFIKETAKKAVDSVVTAKRNFVERSKKNRQEAKERKEKVDKALENLFDREIINEIYEDEDPEALLDHTLACTEELFDAIGILGNLTDESREKIFGEKARDELLEELKEATGWYGSEDAEDSDTSDDCDSNEDCTEASTEQDFLEFVNNSNRTLEDFKALPYIGNARAKRLVDFDGEFNTLDEFLNFAFSGSGSNSDAKAVYKRYVLSREWDK